MSVTTRAAPALRRSGGVVARSPHGPAGGKPGRSSPSRRVVADTRWGGPRPRVRHGR